MKERSSVTLASTVRASPQVVSAEHPGEVVILDPRSSAYFGLDDVGAAIWDRLARPVTVGWLVEEILAAYDAERDRLEEDVLTLLDELARRGLIDVDPPP